jgi:lipid II:glycine glycyltransferase (peptidoglycan interpeptide bridge formation enzyme)
MDRIDRYLEGIKKVPKGKKINKKTVSEAIGIDPNLLNPSRDKKYPTNPAIRQMIEDAETERLKKDKKADKLVEETRIKNKFKDERDDYKNKLEKAYAREVMLVNRIHELETELAQYKNENGLKLAPKRR